MAHGVLVRWRTSFESGALGFNIYRQGEGNFSKLNRTLIPTASGRAYSWLDRTAPKSGTLKYRLQAVPPDGARHWVGATSVAR